MMTKLTESRNQSLRNLSQRVLAVLKVCPAIQKYLRLLLSFLILEVLGVLTSSHCLKFRSNTHRKCSLLINNKVLNILPLYSEQTLQTQSFLSILMHFQARNCRLKSNFIVLRHCYKP